MIDKQSSKPTRRRFLLQVGQWSGFAFLSACQQLSTEPTRTFKSKRTPDSEMQRPPLAKAITPQLGSETVTLDQQIGQMIMAGFDGKYLTESSAIVEDVRNQRVGGVALFGRNIESVEQVQLLTGILQRHAPVPLFISIDQEGGRVRRLDSSFGLQKNYSAAQLGALNDLMATASYAREMATTLHNLGINLNLAPVVDVNVNPYNPVIGSQERSFSADPEVVTSQALSFIRAHHQQEILCTIKHFPGHGSSTSDSHVGFVDVTETWTKDELTPFEGIINAGSCDAVMTAHIFNAHLDEKQPATLSKAIITGLLRQRMAYDGVIITDDIQMGAIWRYYDFETAIGLSVEAGIDVFTISRYSPALVNQIFLTIRKLMRERKISEERIHQSYQRIINLKAKIPAPRLPTDSDSAPLNQPDASPHDSDYWKELDRFLF